MNNLKAHSQRRSLINNFLLAAIITIVVCYVTGCQKQSSLEDKVDPVKYYWRITDVDKDGKEMSTPIFSGMVSSTTLNDHGDDDTEGWQAWLMDKRKQWCENHNPHHKHYCLICSFAPICAATPVTFSDWGIVNNSVTWTTVTESNVDYFRIDYSKDGTTFKNYGRMAPNGPSKYIFEIK